MSEEKNRQTVTIYGQTYTIVGIESPEYIRMLADYVDEMMHRITKDSNRLGTARLAVLTAVNLADELFRLQKEHEELIQLLEEDETMNPATARKQS